MTEEEMAESERETNEAIGRMKKVAEEGTKNILRYFDRIHDKLFTLNNILIAGFFGFSKIGNQIPPLAISIPIANLVYLIYIEWRMMEKSRFESNIMDVDMKLIPKLGEQIKSTTRHSLFAILTTAVVLGFFLYFVFR